MRRTKLGGFHLRNPVKSSAEELFLKPHKPDRKCILDPTEVKNVGRFQADDIIRQAGISEGGQEDNQWTKAKIPMMGKRVDSEPDQSSQDSCRK